MLHFFVIFSPQKKTGSLEERGVVAVVQSEKQPEEKKASATSTVTSIWVQLDVYRRRQRKEDAIPALVTPFSTFGMHNLRLS